MTLRAIATWIGLLTPLAAQDPADVFLSRYRAAEEQRAGGAAEAAVVQAGFRSALTGFLRVPRDNPRYGELLPFAAHASSAAGDHAMAVELTTEILDAGGSDYAAELLVRSLCAVGRPREALDAARRLDPLHALAIGRALLATHNAVAEVAASRLRAGDTEVALWWFRGVATAGDRGAFALSNLALSLRFLGRLEEAETLYREALTGAPRDDVLWNDFGLCLKAAKRLPEAIAAFRRSISCESAAGQGPGTTNLVLLARNGMDVGRDPLVAVTTVLVRRPAAALPRRLCLDLLLPRTATGAGAGARERSR